MIRARRLSQSRQSVDAQPRLSCLRFLFHFSLFLHFLSWVYVVRFTLFGFYVGFALSQGRPHSTNVDSGVT